MSVVGYQVILPRPWTRIPLGAEAPQRVRDLVAEQTVDWQGTVPPDQAGPLRRQLEQRLLTQVEQARRHGGVDLYLPVGRANGLILGASFVVSEVAADGVGAAGATAEEVLAAVLAEGGAQVELDGARWARREEVRGPDRGDAESDVPTRRVSYLGPRPDDPTRWVLVGFSCVGDGDPDSPQTAVVVELFDAIMGTWTWRSAPTRGDEGEA